MERTFVMVKPDGVKRKLIGAIISRLEAKGFDLVAIRSLGMSRQLAEEHYSEHRGKPFFDELIQHITAGAVVAMVWQGPNAIALTRILLGHRDPLQAAPGTIRGDFANTSGQNLVHAADSPQSAQREISLFFGTLGDEGQ